MSWASTAVICHSGFGSYLTPLSRVGSRLWPEEVLTSRRICKMCIPFLTTFEWNYSCPTHVCLCDQESALHFVCGFLFDLCKTSGCVLLISALSKCQPSLPRVRWGTWWVSVLISSNWCGSNWSHNKDIFYTVRMVPRLSWCFMTDMRMVPQS